LELGNLYRAQGDSERAIAQYEKLRALNPHFVDAQVLVGNLYLRKNDLSSARRYYEAALAYDPHSGLAENNLAWLYVLQGGDLNVALGMAEDAKQQLPSVPSVNGTLAWIYYLKGNYRNALPLLRECVQKVPENATYHYRLGMVELAIGDKRTARSELEAALNLKLAGDDAVRARQALQQTN
jgi:tetratricopeptide (TPR) repeat protein